MPYWSDMRYECVECLELLLLPFYLRAVLPELALISGVTVAHADDSSNLDGPGKAIRVLGLALSVVILILVLQ